MPTDDQEPFDVAQGMPSYTGQQIKDNAGRQPPPPPPGKPMQPPAAPGGLFEGIEQKERRQRTPEEKAGAAQKRKDTIMGDRFESPNIRPISPDQWKEWAKSLSIKHGHWARELDKWLQDKGFKGITDPKLPPKYKGYVDELMNESAPHWFEQSKHRHRKPDGAAPPNDPKSDTFSPPRSELKEFGPEIGILGGREMGGDDEEAMLG